MRRWILVTSCSSMILAGCGAGQGDTSGISTGDFTQGHEYDETSELPVVETEPSYYGAPLEGTVDALDGCPVLRSSDGVDLLLWLPGTEAHVNDDGRLEVTIPSSGTTISEGESVTLYGRAGRPDEARGVCAAVLDDEAVVGSFLVQSIPNP